MILKSFFIIFISLCLSVKSQAQNKIIQLSERTFSKQTNITFDQQHRSFASNQNSMIYFFIQGQQKQETHKKNIAQFQAVANSYIKSKQQQIILNENSQLDQSQENIPQNIPTIHDNTPKQSTNQIKFFIVKCSINNQKQDSLCSTLGLYKAQMKQKLFFFTQNSQVIQYTNQILQDKLIFLISKLQENSQLFTIPVHFDEELNKLASKYEVPNLPLKNRAINFLVGLKSYLTWDLLKFLFIFGILPFLFGYLSSRSQQKANKQRMEKYASNVDSKEQPKSKELKRQ